MKKNIIRNSLFFIGFIIAMLSVILIIQARYMKDEPPMIGQREAIMIATQKAIEIRFDVANLKPNAQLVEGNWDVRFERTDDALGGVPYFLIDGKTGEVLEVRATQ